MASGSAGLDRVGAGAHEGLVLGCGDAPPEPLAVHLVLDGVGVDALGLVALDDRCGRSPGRRRRRPASSTRSSRGRLGRRRSCRRRWPSTSPTRMRSMGVMPTDAGPGDVLVGPVPVGSAGPDRAAPGTTRARTRSAPPESCSRYGRKLLLLGVVPDDADRQAAHRGSVRRGHRRGAGGRRGGGRRRGAWVAGATVVGWASTAGSPLEQALSSATAAVARRPARRHTRPGVPGSRSRFTPGSLCGPPLVGRPPGSSAELVRPRPRRIARRVCQ